MRKWIVAAGLAACVILTAGGVVYLRGFTWTTSPWAQGNVVTTFDGVPVYDNGPLFAVSHGRHYAPDGYYFGQKWQCVEFIKRYLYQTRGHRMPDVMGHAVSFFDPSVPQGGVNAARGMVQYKAGGNEAPKKGDLIVFAGAGGYGHVGIVVAAGADFIEVAQQNKPPARERIELAATSDKGIRSIPLSGLPALGWLRLP